MKTTLLGFMFAVACTLTTHTVHAATDGKSRQEVLEELCAGKDAKSCYELARTIEASSDKREDLARVLELFDKSCMLGHAGGCVDLGYILTTRAKPFYTLRLYKEDDGRALELFNRACVMQAEEGCNNYGLMYEQGRGTDEDVNLALYLYNAACELGSAKGCDNYKRLAETIEK
jgi:TPR repeat protein